MVRAAEVPEFVGLIAVEGKPTIVDLITENVGDTSLTMNDLPKVPIPGAGGEIWAVPGMGGPEGVNTIEGVIIMAQSHRRYYVNGFEDGGGNSAPDCSAPDSLIGYGTPGGICDNCPMAKWGSAAKGKGQACSLRKTLVILRPHEYIPLTVDISPASLTELKNYGILLAKQGKSLSSVVTSIMLEKTTSGSGVTYSKCKFHCTGILDEATAKVAYEQGQSLRAIIKLVDPEAPPAEPESHEVITHYGGPAGTVQEKREPLQPGEDPFGYN